MTAFPEHTVLKVVPLRFSGVDLRLKTSHALFSSHHVDDGTMLLLKTLAQRQAIPAQGRVLDAGCGYGPLALAIKKFRPDLEVVARDRLALAAAFTAENARLNGVTVDARPGLLLDEPGPWNLIVSNVPAKAGEPVLADFVRRSLGLLAEDGLAAAVVVEPLAPWFGDQLDREGARVVYRESGPGYTVFHWGPGAPVSPLGPPFPEAYRRSEVSWSVGSHRFTQPTYYGLPNFDALDYRLQVTIPLLDAVSFRGEVLVWEPIQGHLASWAARSASAVHLAGNDTLGLAVGAHSLGSATLHPVATMGQLELGPGSLGGAVVQIHSEPEVPWVDDMAATLVRVLAPGAPVVINGTSTDLVRFLDQRKGLRKVQDLRSKGWRAVILERQTLP